MVWCNSNPTTIHLETLSLQMDLRLRSANSLSFLEADLAGLDLEDLVVLSVWRGWLLNQYRGTLIAAFLRISAILTPTSAFCS